MITDISDKRKASDIKLTSESEFVIKMDKVDPQKVSIWLLVILYYDAAPLSTTHSIESAHFF